MERTRYCTDEEFVTVTYEEIVKLVDKDPIKVHYVNVQQDGLNETLVPGEEVVLGTNYDRTIFEVKEI